MASGAGGKSTAAARFVGAQSCMDCHQQESAAWQKSQHAAAMQPATPTTVLGDFHSATFSYNGVTSTFFRRDDKFFVKTDGPDGKLADYEILYTFGLYPLQQYLIPLPGGRLQALSIAWDARPVREGGGHWFHLYPDDKVTFKDPLHWTRLSQNWNWMCANCHTTKLDRNYDAAHNTYATHWSEINVACEACHGPGSNHIAWEKHAAGSEQFAANKGLVVALNERKGITWAPVPSSGNAVRSAPLASMRELGVCAQCHSRRSALVPGMDHDGHFLDTHELALLTDALYFPDGQQRAEVYDVGSFLQSRMHAHGVTCSDCHDPHSGKLRIPGNGVCAQCHSPTKYDRPAHTLHSEGSPGAQCSECHMPTRTYMRIDARHDHSIRIPRPDLSAALGTPNACTGCHKDQEPAWAAQIIEKAFGPQREGYQSFGPILYAARSGTHGSAASLMALAEAPDVPSIVHATAIAELHPYLSAAAVPALQHAMGDADPLVRGAALETLLGTPPALRVQLATPLIDDPILTVRVRAARALAVAPTEGMDEPTRARLEKAFAEYVASQQANADRPEAHMNLGAFYAERREPTESETEYRKALALDRDFVPGYINLADLYRMYAREADAEAILNAGFQVAPANPDLLYALGLLRTRQGRSSEAIRLLAQAAHGAPENVHYAYVYGVALHDTGQVKKGVAVLERALASLPYDPLLLSGLAAYAREAGDLKRAEAYSRRLALIAE